MSRLSYFMCFLICCCGGSLVNSDIIPAGVQKCRFADDACLTAGVQYVLKNYAKVGIKDLGLVPLDPLHIKKFSLAKNVNSPVSIDMTFTEVDLLGLQDAHVKHAGGFKKSLDTPITLDAIVPKFILRGPYSVDGRVLILPIVGKGQGQFILENTHLQVKLKVKPVIKSAGEIHANIVNVQLQLNPERVIYKLEGLFNGQKDLSDNLHAFINENWQDIFNELKPDISEALGLVVKHFLNRVFSKHSITFLFNE